MVSAVLLGLLLAVTAPAVRSCSCPVEAFRVSRSEEITNTFCSTYSSDIYAGTVVGVSCNCIPTPGGEIAISAALDCQQYRLNDEGDSVSASVVTRGMCRNGGYQEFYYTPGCSQLGDAVAANFTVEMSTSPVGLTDLSNDLQGCREACPLPPMTFFGPLPCTYNISVVETFKGSYSRGDVITVIGPDVATSCGNFGRRLTIGTVYMAGIGGPCSPIGEWSALSQYSTEELNLLRSFQAANPCTTTEPGVATLRPTVEPATRDGDVTYSTRDGVTPEATATAVRNMAPAACLLGSTLLAAFFG